MVYSDQAVDSKKGMQPGNGTLKIAPPGTLIPDQATCHGLGFSELGIKKGSSPSQLLCFLARFSNRCSCPGAWFQ